MCSHFSSTCTGSRGSESPPTLCYSCQIRHPRVLMGLSFAMAATRLSSLLVALLNAASVNSTPTSSKEETALCDKDWVYSERLSAWPSRPSQGQGQVPNFLGAERIPVYSWWWRLSHAALEQYHYTSGQKVHVLVYRRRHLFRFDRQV